MSAPVLQRTLLVVLGGLHVSLLDVLPLALFARLACVAWLAGREIARTPRFRLSQMRSEPVSKALCPVSVLVLSRCLAGWGCDVQLHAEGSGENGAEECDVAPDDGAAVDCQ